MKYPILTLIILVMLVSALFGYPDPGEPDTVRITGGPLVVGQSVPLYFTVVNDELIEGISCGLLLEELTNGFATFDSAVYIDRMADPTVLPLRVARYWIHSSEIGISPDTINLISYTVAGANSLPIGNSPIIEVYFTGTAVGTMLIDSTFYDPAGDFLLTYMGQSIYPQFVGLTVEIIEGNLPPVLSIGNKNITLTSAGTAATQISFDSPEGFPVELEVVGMHAYDDENVTPVNQPGVDSGNPAEFTWIPTSADIGIWSAVVQACDSSGACTTDDITIQVVENGNYLITFTQDSVESDCASSGIVHGDFDLDEQPEVITVNSGQYNQVSLELYDYSGFSWDVEYQNGYDGHARFGPVVGYIDLDNYLDIVVMRYISSDAYLEIYHGDGENSFNVTGSSNDGSANRYLVLGEFTRDSHLDIASSFYTGITIFSGNSQGGFTQSQFIDPADSVLSLISSDFNDDGFDDLAVGLVNGVQIYLGDSQGGFITGAFYSQIYGSTNIDVTSQGSDFNNDGYYDLCISTPSVGGDESQLVTYLGDGDGTFTQTVTRTVQGQILGNTICDINLDGELDIVFVNGAREYISVLFGDGDGGFSNELRFDIPHVYPQYIDACDFDLDGDVDLVVAANQFPRNFDLYFLENQLDPGGFFDNSFSMDLLDNGKLEIVSPSNKVLNQIKNTIPASEYYRCNLDNTDMLDERAILGLVESGCYNINIQPELLDKSAETFSLEYVQDGNLYRLAKDASMSAEGYVFPIYPDGSSQIGPRSGQFISTNPPLLSWSGEGSYDYQFASDIDFENIIQSGSVDINYVLLSETLEYTDSTTYYWRIKPAGAAEYECLYALNMVTGSAGGCGDANGDGSVNVSDAVFIINYVFSGGNPPVPYEIGDVNCDTKVNVSDAVYLINYVFSGGHAPCDTDGDTVPEC